MELSKEEIKTIEFYKNFYKHISNPQLKHIDNLSKEKIWVQIYQKLPIDTSIQSLLFFEIDQTSILNELDTLVQSMNS